MSLDCASITSVKVNGSNRIFGGYIYNLSTNISYTSPSEFEISVISEDGNFSISPADLNSEISSTISINSRAIKAFPVSFNTSDSPAGTVLSVKYKDGSVRYLDKTVVALLGLQVSQSQADQNSKLIAIGSHVAVWSTEASGNNADFTVQEVPVYEFGDSSVYSSKQLLAKIVQKGIPVTSRFSSAMSRGTYGVSKSHYGNLRSVLQSWGSDLGYIFFWNFFDGVFGAIDAIDIADGVGLADAQALSQQMYNSFYKYITNVSGGYSIEDNFTTSGSGLFSLSSGEGGSVEGTRRFELFDIKDKLFPFRTNLTCIESTGSKSYIKDYRFFYEGANVSADFKNAVAAALVGPTFFKKYVIHSLTSRAAVNRILEPQTDYRTAEEIAIEGEGSLPYNLLLAKYYENYYDVEYTGKFTSLSTGRGINAENFAILKKTNEVANIWEAQPTAIAYTSFITLKDPNNAPLETVDSDELYRMLRIYGNFVGRFFYKQYTKNYYNMVDFVSSVEWFPDDIVVESTPVGELGPVFCEIGPGVKFGPFVRGQCVGGGVAEDDANDVIFRAGVSIDGTALFDSGAVSSSAAIDESLIIADIIDPEGVSANKEETGFKRRSLAYFFTKVANPSTEIAEKSNIKTSVLEYRNVSYRTDAGGAPLSQTRRVLQNLSDPKVSVNEMESKEISREELINSYYATMRQGSFPSATLNDVMAEYMSFLFTIQNEPSYFSEYQLSTIPTPSADWMRLGLDSFSVNYGGEGVSCSVRISTQKRAVAAHETIKRKIYESVPGARSAKVVGDGNGGFPTRFKTQFRRL
jgi:hypothetical protein